MKRILLGIIFLLSYFNIQAQILVVKIDENGIVQPISYEDIEKYNQQIVEILLKYSWPTCIAQDLTDEEKVELLTSDKSGAELEFIRKKIKAVSKNLDVIFIPTTLYELFIIKTIKDLGSSTHSQNPSLFYILNKSKEGISEKISKKALAISPAEYIKQKINKEYNRFNNKILGSLFKDKSVLVFHKMFIQYLKSDFLKSPSLSSLDVIKDYFYHLLGKTDVIHKKLTDEIHKALYDKRYEIMKKILQSKNILSSSLGIDANDQLKIIKSGVDLDYKGFEKNQALLFRGSSFLNVPALHGPKKIVATTVRDTVSYQDQERSIKKSPAISSYSLSFGNSLFAGIYNDKGACAYSYLNNRTDLGYAIFIDKFAYIDNYISNLFFIAPLATEVGLLGSGEWFHSRSKPVVLVKIDQKVFVIGVAGTAILDPYGVFLVVRNPYKQAQLFSEYLAKNGVILHKGEHKDLTDEEKNGLVDLMKNQQEIGIEYKVAAWFKGLEHKLKEAALKKKQMPRVEQSKGIEQEKQKEPVFAKNKVDEPEKKQDPMPKEKQDVGIKKNKSISSNWISSWF